MDYNWWPKDSESPTDKGIKEKRYFYYNKMYLIIYTKLIKNELYYFLLYINVFSGFYPIIRAFYFI